MSRLNDNGLVNLLAKLNTTKGRLLKWHNEHFKDLDFKIAEVTDYISL